MPKKSIPYSALSTRPARGLSLSPPPLKNSTTATPQWRIDWGLAKFFHLVFAFFFFHFLFFSFLPFMFCFSSPFFLSSFFSVPFRFLVFFLFVAFVFYNPIFFVGGGDWEEGEIERKKKGV